MRWALLVLAACKAPEPGEVDEDGDGVFADVDCDDGDPLVAPGLLEQVYDGVDNDCDPATADDDLDGDGLLRDADCDDRDPLRPTVEVPYDGVDNDCDPGTREDDLDEDGHPLGPDCDDADPDVNPDATEIFYDGIDNDCDPLNTVDDDQDEDGVGLALDCDDLDPFARAPLAWFVDCDADGFAPGPEDAVEACVLPDPPSACPAGGWTLTEPVGPAYDAGNTSVDCVDVDPGVFPGQAAFPSEPVIGASGGPWDVDCDGQESPEIAEVFTCEVVPAAFPPGAFVCVFTDGWADGVPVCGATGNLLAGCTLLGDLPSDCAPASSATELSVCR